MTIVLTAILFLMCGFPQGSGPKEGAKPYVRKLVLSGYPALARQARIQGEVSAVVHIDTDGKVIAVSGEEGAPLLRDSLTSLKKWEFILPEPKETRLRVTFRFVLAGPEQRESVQTRVTGVLPDFVEIVTNPTSEKPGPDQIPGAK